MSRKAPEITPEMMEEFRRQALEEDAHRVENKAYIDRDMAERARIDELIEQLKEARKRSKFTLDDLARQTGIAKPNLSAFENHPKTSPKIETLNKVARALGFRVSIKLVKAKRPHAAKA